MESYNTRAKTQNKPQELWILHNSCAHHWVCSPFKKLYHFEVLKDPIKPQHSLQLWRLVLVMGYSRPEAWQHKWLPRLSMGRINASQESMRSHNRRVQASQDKNSSSNFLGLSLLQKRLFEARIQLDMLITQSKTKLTYKWCQLFMRLPWHQLDLLRLHSPICTAPFCLVGFFLENHPRSGLRWFLILDFKSQHPNHPLRGTQNCAAICLSPVPNSSSLHSSNNHLSPRNVSTSSSTVKDP